MQILIELKSQQIVKSLRGKEGGYLLARPPAEITMADVLRCVHGQVFDSPALTDEQCPPELRGAWRRNCKKQWTTPPSSITFQKIARAQPGQGKRCTTSEAAEFASIFPGLFASQRGSCPLHIVNRCVELRSRIVTVSADVKPKKLLIIGTLGGGRRGDRNTAPAQRHARSARIDAAGQIPFATELRDRFWPEGESDPISCALDGVWQIQKQVPGYARGRGRTFFRWHGGW